MIAFRATKRGLTDRETTMEDTHVWVMNADGSGRREFATIDDRQGVPVWAATARDLFHGAGARQRALVSAGGRCQRRRRTLLMASGGRCIGSGIGCAK